MTFSPARLHGHALVPPSKSEAHRALLLAALGQGECCLHGFPPPLCDDTIAMVNGITALGAKVRQDGAKLIVTPAPTAASSMMVECDVRACAAALRMLIPAFLLRGQPVRFLMEPSLFHRPLDELELLAKIVRIPERAIEITGQLPAGSYEIDGSRSSQFASGMLIALAHAAPSRLRVTGSIVSRPYLDMTLQMMKRFRAPYTETSEGVFELSPITQPSPAEIAVSGDWTQAAVFLCMNAMGSDIDIDNLADDGLQGDARIWDILNARQREINCTDIPDLAPMLALTCSQWQGVSTLTGVSRLRIKESDRLSAMQDLLHQLGARTEFNAESDALRVWGSTKLKGGFEADARGDHRLVMFLAAAALVADAPITVHGVECISKSWPGFIQTYQQLGGIVQ